MNNSYINHSVTKLLWAFIILLANIANNDIFATSPQEITTMKQYDNAVKSSKPAVFMYCSNHCTPCRTMKPHFMQVAQEFPNVAFYMINTSIGALGSLIQNNNIMGLPTITYLQNGQEVRRDRKGAMPVHEIRQSVNAAFNNNTKNANQNKDTQNNTSQKNSAAQTPQTKSTNNQVNNSDKQKEITQTTKTNSNKAAIQAPQQTKITQKAPELKKTEIKKPAPQKTEAKIIETQNLNNKQLNNNKSQQTQQTTK